jgi:Flp pilus assembly CpaE family ATPase
VLTRNPEGERWRGLNVYPLAVEVEVPHILLALDEAVRGTHRARPPRQAVVPHPPVADAGERQDQLQVLVFWGGAGSPGRTTLAINWGTLLGSAARTILVDLDLTGAALAAQLDDAVGETGRRRWVSPNLVELASANPETAEAWTRELGRTVVPLGPFSPHGFVLRGVPRPVVREALSGAFVERLIAELRRRYTYVLLDAGDEPLGDGSREAAVTSAALRAADQVLVVAPPDGPGLHQTYMALLEARSVLDWQRAAAIVNRYDARWHQAELARVESALGLPLAGVLPLDTAAMQRALADGRPVVCDPRSRLRRPLQRLVEQVHGGQLRMPAAARPARRIPVLGRLRAALAGRRLALGGSQ